MLLYRMHVLAAEQKKPMSVGARTQPCLTPLRIWNGSEELPLSCIVPFVSVWKVSIIYSAVYVCNHSLV